MSLPAGDAEQIQDGVREEQGQEEACIKQMLIPAQQVFRSSKLVNKDSVERFTSTTMCNYNYDN